MKVLLTGPKPGLLVSQRSHQWGLGVGDPSPTCEHSRPQEIKVPISNSPADWRDARS